MVSFVLFAQALVSTYRNVPWSTEPKHRVIALLRWRPLETGHCVFREISTFLRDNDYKLYIRPEKRQGPSAVSREVSVQGQSTVSNDQN